jgi:hypothetical protein
MSCNKKQIQEAARLEYNRLKELINQGITTDEATGIDDVVSAANAMKLASKGSKISFHSVYTPPIQIDSDIINDINNDKPVYNNRDVTVVKGYISKGQAKLVIKDNEKGFYQTVGAALVDGNDLRVIDKIRYSDESTSRVGKSDNDVKINLVNDDKVDLGTQMKELVDNLIHVDNKTGVGAINPKFKEFRSTVVDLYSQSLAEAKMNNVTVEMFKNAIEPTGGEIDLDSNTIRIRWNAMSRLSSPSEVFLHEVGHLQAKDVLAKNPEIMRVLQDLRNSALDKGLDYNIFLDKTKYSTDLNAQGEQEVYIGDEPTPDEIKIAKAKFDYVFDRSADIEEFYAYATSNEQVWQAIQDIEIDSKLVKEVEVKSGEKLGRGTSFLNTIIQLVNKLWNSLTGRDPKGGQILTNMIVKIANAQIEMSKDSEVGDEHVNKSESVMRKLDALDEQLEPVATRINEWLTDIKGDTGDKLVKVINKVRPLRELMETGVAQYIWRMVAQDTTRVDVADMYKVFRVSKSKVEKHTNDIRNGIQLVVGKMYEGVDSATKEAIVKSILNGDLASIVDGEAGIVKLRKHLSNDKARLAEINKLEEALKVEYSKEAWNEVSKQIDGLSTYILTGKTVGLNQQINANNIAVMMNIDSETKNHYAANENIVKMIDKLVTLKSISQLDPEVVPSLNKMLSTDDGKEIVRKTAVMYNNYMADMKKDTKVGIYDPIPKGYTRIQDGKLKYELIPADQVEGQMSVNMSLVNDEVYTVVDGINYYMMVGRVKDVGFNEGALGVISNTLEGISVTSLIKKSNEYREGGELFSGALDIKVKAILEEIKNGTNKRFSIGKNANVVPVYNSMMEIVDYKIKMSIDEDRINRPDREYELSDVLSNTFARSAKVNATVSNNANVVDTIIGNTAKGILTNPENYVLIEEYTDEDRENGVVKELRHERWDRLPEYTKQYIHNKLGANGIPIHKDFVELMMGEKEVTIGNFAKFGFDMKKHPIARARLMALESYIKEILGYVKEAIVLLSPDVLIGNTVSNFMVALVHGVRPDVYIKKAKKKWLELNDYNEKLQLLTELEVLGKTGENVDNKIIQLRRQLENNPFNDLIKDGQYTPIVEDINVDMKPNGQLYTMMQNAIDNNRFGDIINTVKDVAYVSTGTKAYRLLLKTVHYGDIITRQIIKEELESKLKQSGKWNAESKENLMNYLDQLLVNYGYTMNRWMGYAEKVAGLLFMKYYLAQGKAILSMTFKNPTKMIGIAGLQAVTGVNISDPTDTYLKADLMDAISYRTLLTDAPGEILTPNIFDMVPSMDSFIKIR